MSTEWTILGEDFASRSDVRTHLHTALANGNLIRKSFEHRGVNIDAGELSRRTSILEPRGESSLYESAKFLNSYWAREHAMAHLFREDYGIAYEEYLPGRVYTYRALFKRIQETLRIKSLVEVGCGSAMLSHEASRHGITTIGIDYSVSALGFARYLATEFGTGNLTLVDADALGNWMPPLLPADLVSNLGSLEHMSFEGQFRFARFMGQLSRKYVLLAVPNPRSPLFNLMEKHELSIKDNTWVYPDEPTQFGVDFRKLGDALGWSIVRESYIHVASTTLTREVEGLGPLRECARQAYSTGSPAESDRGMVETGTRVL